MAAYQASKLSTAELPCLGSDQPAWRPVRNTDTRLPQAALIGSVDAYEVLRRRRSIRTFLDAPVPLTNIAPMVDYVERRDAEAWARERAGGRRLRYFLLARKIDGLAPGAYEIDPDTGTAACICELAGAEFAEFFRQPEFASAPAAFWLAGDLAANLARHGEFGHRLLLQRAGFAGHELWMAALAVGMAGCLVGGMVASAGRARLGLDGYWGAGLIGFAFGFDGSRSEAEDA